MTAMDMYPAIANGTSIIRGSRTKAGEVCEMLIELSGSRSTEHYPRRILFRTLATGMIRMSPVL